MSAIKKRISNLVDNQLPEFISTEYPKFSTFLQKYYEQLELDGQPLDIINNLSKYNDIDTYEKGLLSEFTTLTDSLSDDDSVIVVADTYAFPDKNGYVMIDEEIIFYAEKTSNSFVDCVRNVSGTTKLGDLYTQSTYKVGDYGNGAEHLSGAQVFNISNLFLYAFVKNYESQYLASFPEESLKKEVDKRTLIKNIKQFYRAKGTEQSIKFIFNSIIAQDQTDIPSIYYPKDNTIKSSTSDWISKYALKVKVISGDPFKVIGQKIYQEEDVFNNKIRNSFAYIDNVLFLGNYDGESIYEVVIAPETVVGQFQVAQKTFLTKRLLPNSENNNRINVFSTTGWKNTAGKIRIGNETIAFKDKTVNQFVIDSRTGNGDYPVNTPVYNYSNLVSEYEENGITEKVTFLALGILYNLKVADGKPYSSEGDVIQISDVGFETRNPVIFDKSNSSSRWILNENYNFTSISGLEEVLSDVSAIYEDEQYYYIASSGYPSYNIGNFGSLIPRDQKHLKLIKKESVRNTELYPTGNRDVGIFLNGVLAYGYKDYDDTDVTYGGIEKITVNPSRKGKGYKNPPYVIIEGDREARARAILSGDVIEAIEIINPGEKYEEDPKVTITSGREAIVTATVTRDKVTKLNILNPGEYYSTPPLIVIRDITSSGRLAEYTSIISSSGKLIGFNKINEGKFYSQENVEVLVIPVGGGAEATANVKKWKKNRYEVLKNSLDLNNGFLFENIERSFGCGYAHIANPPQLRNILGDINETVHSPILGYAYDGNPIYGPYGYSNPLDPDSSVKRMDSSFRLKTERIGGPDTSIYPIGVFVEDYRYQHRFGDLDENNGRYCVTPDYPSGVYAYFISINQNDIPVFPYILGERYYSIPVESNYISKISQTDIPSKSRRLRTQSIPNNGVNVSAVIETVKEGNITSVEVEESPNTFAIGSSVIINNSQTGGGGCTAQVSSLKGKNIISIESTETKAIKIESKNPVYFFDTSIITQENSNASGEVVGDIFSSNNFVLRNISGEFNAFDKLNSDIRVVNLIVDKSSFYTNQTIIRLTSGKEATILSLNNNFLRVAFNPFANGDGVSFSTSRNGIEGNKIYYVVNASANQFQLSTTPNGSPITLVNAPNFGVVATSEIAKGIILETVNDGNNVKVKVTDGNFTISNRFYLKSEIIDDTIGSRIFKIDELSKNVEVFNINNNIALVTTDENHNITEDDKVTIDIIPDDSITTTNYYVRKRIYQTVKLFQPEVTTTLNDTGIGSLKVLNFGDDYANADSDVFTNVELIFADQTRCRDRNGFITTPEKSFIGAEGSEGNAKATITVVDGKVSQNGVVITTKGVGYNIGDILTVKNEDLQRLTGSLSSSVLYLEVTHVGLGILQTQMILSDLDGISSNDTLKINNEIVKVTSVNPQTKSVTIIRGFANTTRSNHFNNSVVVYSNAKYNFTEGVRIGSSTGDAYIKEYNAEKQELTVVYDTNQSLQSINSLSFATTFFDTSTPAKIVRINSIVSPSNYKFEFSKNNTNGPWIKNPIIEIQKYYKYRFVTNHPSLAGSFLEFSPSKNKNILTTEVVKGNVLPGSGTVNSSFVDLKLGFGDASPTNDYTTKKNLDFTNYYYYDKAGIVDSEDSYLLVDDDPLQGEKTVNYVSAKSFAYSLEKRPEYDGSGTFTYTTTSLFSTGEIDKIFVSNSGNSYKKLPTIYGIRPANVFECIANVNYDNTTKRITSVSIQKAGINYSKPVAILITESRNIPKFTVVKGNYGEIIAVVVEKNDFVFEEKPLIYIVETDLKAYLSSDTIGIPKNIKVTYNGSNFYNDTSISSLYTSHQILTISNFDKDSFLNGEIVRQFENGNLIAEGKISADGYRNDINIIKVINVSGEFKEGLSIIGSLKKNTAIVRKSFYSLITSEIKSYYDNAGYYESDKGKISSSNQKIADSYFYQDYAYVVKSKSPINIWRKLVEQTVHPSGFKMFGEVAIEATAPIVMPENQTISSSLTVIELWDETANRVTIESTRRQITQSILKVENKNIQRGVGSVFVNEADTSEMLAYSFNLQQSFDGDYNESGNIVGRKAFNMVLPGTNGVLNIANANNLLITLDGVIQEPGVAFTVSNSTLTFTRAPLGQRLANNQLISPQKFVGRMIRFKNNELNNTFFKKIQTIENDFDNVSTRFPLYYEDGSDVILQPKENLLVSLDGVLQESKITPLFPATAAYYIDRTVVPNQIVFVDAPRKIDNVNRSRFFAFSIGNYEKFKVDENLFDGNKKGPFLLKAVFGNRPVNLDEDKTILVFIDGVLQIKNRAYNIVGSNIYFSEAPRVGQKISILFVFGRQSRNTLTFYNFENNRFFNIVDIEFTEDSAIPFGQFYEGATVYQGDSIENWECVGQVIDYGKSGVSKIIIRQNNYPFDENKDLKVYRPDSADFVVSSSQIASISAFIEDENRNQIVYEATKSSWLRNLQVYPTTYKNLEINDLIKVDGENDYRRITSTPQQLKKIGHRKDDIVSRNHFGSVGVTEYNGIISGVGLSVVAKVSNGQILELEWNKRDYSNIKKVDQSTAYGYVDTLELIFVPQPVRDSFGNITGPVTGGGASGYAIVNNTEVIDVVLTNPGSEYLVPPRIYVTKKYDIVKSSENIVKSRTDLFLRSEISAGESKIYQQITILPANQILSPSIVSISDVKALYNSTNPTIIITPKPKIVAISDTIKLSINNTIETKVPEIATIVDTYKQITTILHVDTIVTSFVKYERKSTQIVEFGVVDTFADNLKADKYTQGKLGNRFRVFEDNKFIDNGYSRVSDFTLQEIDAYYPTLTIEDIEKRYETSFTENGELWTVYLPTIQEYGAILDSALSSTLVYFIDSIDGFLGQTITITNGGLFSIVISIANDYSITIISVSPNAPFGTYVSSGGTRFVYQGGDTTVYIPNTSRFAEQGKLLIGKEIVYYTSKLPDRFLGVTRGYDNTTATSHNAGDYLRSMV